MATREEVRRYLEAKYRYRHYQAPTGPGGEDDFQASISKPVPPDIFVIKEGGLVPLDGRLVDEVIRSYRRGPDCVFFWASLYGFIVGVVGCRLWDWLVR